MSCSQLLNSSNYKNEFEAIGPGQEITVFGRVQSIRKQKNWAFAHISDGSTVRPLQAILSPEQAAGLTTGTALQIKGQWKSSPGKGQDSELKASQIKITGALNDPAVSTVMCKVAFGIRALADLQIPGISSTKEAAFC